MKNLIYAALASYNMDGKDAKVYYGQRSSFYIYIECAITSLASAKFKNPDSDVALVVNFDMPQKYKQQFEKYNIKLIKKEFDKFYFGPGVKWGLAFYKLCVIDYVVNTLDYDNFLCIDLDTYTINKIDDLWKECKFNVLLFDIQHKISNPQNLKLHEEYKILYGVNPESYFVNYGGEFVCGNKNNLQKFIKNCYDVYELMLNKNFMTIHGDEFILTLAAHRDLGLIKSANAYIYRYWTGRFYLVSTNFKYNEVDILHLPDEKRLGLKTIYRYLIKHNKLPSNEKAFRIFGFPKAKRPLSFRLLFYRIKKFFEKGKDKK